MMNEQIEMFRNYLQQRKFRESTINAHLLNVGYFIKWWESPSFGGVGEAGNITYNDLLNYVQYEQKRNIDVATINLRMSSISKYFDFLKAEESRNLPSGGRGAWNPARTLRIKGKAKTIIQNPLKYDELLNLYNGYKSITKEVPNHIKEKSSLAHQRNIIIVGLLIWQGLHSGELEKLEVNHINLNDGIIYIPSTARSNSRELKLSTQQILTLHSYLHGGTRDKAPQPPKGGFAERLFGGNMHNIVGSLMEELKGINPQIKNALHIRASVILYWLRQHNKRQVQYMAGHKYINSTEMYEVQELETLTSQLTKHHPFS